MDDNHDTADSEVMLLQLAGFDARACYSGPTALAEAAEFLPDICLIDMNIPEMDGDELAVQLRDRGRPLVLVAVTAMNDDAGRRIKAAGFDQYLLEPVTPATSSPRSAGLARWSARSCRERHLNPDGEADGVLPIGTTRRRFAYPISTETSVPRYSLETSSSF